MPIEVSVVGRPQVIDIDPYPDDEVMREYDVDSRSTPDDEGVHERRRSDEASEAKLSQKLSESTAFEQSLAAHLGCLGYCVVPRTWSCVLTVVLHFHSLQGFYARLFMPSIGKSASKAHSEYQRAGRRF